MIRSWRPEVQTGGTNWSGNGLRFEKKEDAEEWVKDLARRWLLVTDTQVIESQLEPNCPEK